MPHAPMTSNFPPLRLVLAAPGEASRHYDLGLMCIRGENTRRDDAGAAHWFRSSADQGYATPEQAAARASGTTS